MKRYWHDHYAKIVFASGRIIRCALDHKFIIGGTEVKARSLKLNESLGLNCDKIVELVLVKQGNWFYDPVNVANGSIYNHDDEFVSHNTFFGTGDTLFDANTLLGLQSKDPEWEKDGMKIYKQPIKGHSYMAMVDVAKGRGQDYSTMNIIDISTKPFEQVAVYRNNMISPLLFPDIIYKYVTLFNEAYTIVESNDQGALVAAALYHDMEYENLFIESAIKSNALGLNMNKKVKRIGCSNIKDIVESGGLDIVDADTISEMSTFEKKGASYEASDGNHDDLVINLVAFGYFTTTDIFKAQTDLDMRKLLYMDSMKAVEEDIVPIGIFDDHLDDDIFFENDTVMGTKGGWSVATDDGENWGW